MDEHAFPQVIADALTQDAGQVDEPEYTRSLDQDQRSIAGEDVPQSSNVIAQNRFIDDLAAQESEIRVQGCHQGDHQDETEHPQPVRPGKLRDAQGGPAGELGGKFFFFEILVRHYVGAPVALEISSSSCASIWV